ncbi:MAG: hypothetical protein K2N54_02165, partial [Helicobacter sp.]|nr:hypothetical protein [Helicobacter sp.]
THTHTHTHTQGSKLWQQQKHTTRARRGVKCRQRGKPKNKKNYEDFYIQEWNLQYGMNNYKQTKASVGKELLISNFKLEDKSKTLFG